MLPLLLLAQLAANDMPGRDGFLWVECEQFADPGGWRADVQFIEQMGSSYLLAQGLAGPVADASTTVELPKTGIWHLWARTENWCSEAQPAPGRFQVMLDGKPGTVCGAGPSIWAWEYAGAFRHEAGPAALALHDLTGQYSRCDAVLLTFDGQFKPPSDLPGYRALRHQLTGVNGNFAASGSYDVVVVGGGVAGTVAAISAARHGAKTVLIQDRGVLGGNASTEITVGVAGASANRTPSAREGGLLEESHREAKRLGNWSRALGYLSEQEPNLTVRFNCRAIDTVTEGSRIRAVKVRQVLTGEGYLVSGRYFIDTTGDGGVGFAARSYSSPLAENWADTGGVYALYTEPSAAFTTGCAAAAVTDGYSRPAGIAYHGWMSDPEQKLPQWLQLDWDQPVSLGRVELVFDTNLGPRRPSRLVEKECVTDFRLEAKVGEEWQLLKRVEGNYHRLCSETFEPVETTALRLVVEKTGGDGSARVFELRAYEE